MRHPQDPRARARLFNASERDQADAPAQWANPDIGWSRDEMIETAADLGNKPLTVETLQVFSNLIYEEEPIPGQPGAYRTLFGDQRLRAAGWQKFYEVNDRRTGFCAVALYNPISKVVVIVNRGTDFSKTAAEAFKDESTDHNIFMGKRSEQLGQAREFLAEVWRRMGRDSGTQVVLTEHSLGGALVQMQLGASLTEQQFQGMNVVGVTFAALGAEDAVVQQLRGSVPYNIDVTRLRRMAADRLLKFARDGDGFTLRDALIGFPSRSRVLGRTKQLAGLQSAEMTETEDDCGEGQTLCRQCDHGRPRCFPRICHSNDCSLVRWTICDCHIWSWRRLEASLLSRCRKQREGSLG